MKIAVIGGGPSGMMSAISAAMSGGEVTLFEKNEKLGKKLYISGKGRCNLTNDCGVRDFFQNVATNPKFLYGAIAKFPPQSTMEFCTSRGLPLKTERGNRVFPLSDKSSDVIKLFSRELAKSKVNVLLNAPVLSVQYQENGFLLNTISDIAYFDRLILATGGISYSATGSTGDGYVFAKAAGHGIVPPKPALCRILCKNTKPLEGLSLKNVVVGVASGGKVVDSEFGEMLFTADGVGGPSVLTLSSRLNKICLKDACVYVDLKPALDVEKLDARVLRDFSARQNRDFVHSLDALLPERLVKAVAEQSGIPFDKKVNQITAQERSRLVAALKNLRFDYIGLEDAEYGIVTSGGVNVNEVNPATMESKLKKGLFFAGELLDVDGYTGGFNIQIALSTGYVAGTCAAK